MNDRTLLAAISLSLLLAARTWAGEEGPKMELRAFGPPPGTRTELRVTYSFGAGDQEVRATVLRPGPGNQRQAAVLLSEASSIFDPAGILFVDLQESGKVKASFLDPAGGFMAHPLRRLLFPSFEAPGLATGSRWRETVNIQEIADGLFGADGTFETTVEKAADQPGVIRIVRKWVGASNPLEALMPAQTSEMKRTLVIEVETGRVLAAHIYREMKIERSAEADGPQPGSIRFELEVLESEYRPLTEEELRSLPDEIERMRKILAAAEKASGKGVDLGVVGLLLGKKREKRVDPAKLLDAYAKAYPKGLLAPAVEPMRTFIAEQAREPREETPEPEAPPAPAPKGPSREF